MKTKAAPAHFPYSHRTLDRTDGSRLLQDYRRCQTAFNNGAKNWRMAKHGCISRSNEYVAEPDITVMNGADREGAVNACPDPDRNAPITEVAG